jgi:hypothetical protein
VTMMMCWRPWFVALSMRYLWDFCADDDKMKASIRTKNGSAKMMLPSSRTLTTSESAAESRDLVRKNNNHI